MNRDPKSLKGPYRDLVPKIRTLFLTGHGILWRKVLKYGVFLQQSRKQAILSRKCRHTRSGNEILEHLGPIYTWKISLKYRDILHQIEISLKYRVYRKKTISLRGNWAYIYRYDISDSFIQSINQINKIHSVNQSNKQGQSNQLINQFKSI